MAPQYASDPLYDEPVKIHGRFEEVMAALLQVPKLEAQREISYKAPKQRSNMNVGELLRERDRLLTVIEEAKNAKLKIKQLNTLIVMYDGTPTLNGDGAAEAGWFVCDVEDCEFVSPTPQGLGKHRQRAHGLVGKFSRGARRRRGENGTLYDVEPNAQGLFDCPDCERTGFTSQAGVGMHRVRTHGDKKWASTPAKATKAGKK